MSHPNTWPALTYAGLDKAADKLGVVDATDGVTKTLILNELIKRTLATDDISVLTTIGIGTTVPASDYLPIWEAASTSIKRLLLKDLMDRTLASADIDTWMTAINLTDIDAAADQLLVLDASAATKAKRLNAGDILRRIGPLATQDFTASAVTMTTAHHNRRLTNVGASATVTFIALPFLVGHRFSLFRSADYAVRLDPNGAETVGGGGAGKYLELATYGQVDFECFAAGKLAIVGGTAVVMYEP